MVNICSGDTYPTIHDTEANKVSLTPKLEPDLPACGGVIYRILDKVVQ